MPRQATNVFQRFEKRFHKRFSSLSITLHATLDCKRYSNVRETFRQQVFQSVGRRMVCMQIKCFLCQQILSQLIEMNIVDFKTTTSNFKFTHFFITLYKRQHATLHCKRFSNVRETFCQWVFQSVGKHCIHISESCAISLWVTLYKGTSLILVQMQLISNLHILCNVVETLACNVRLQTFF